MKKIIKIRLFTWFEKVPNPVLPNGDPVLQERIAHFGEEVDITNDYYLQRGTDEKVIPGGAFYSDEDADAIRNGTYRGPELALLNRARQGLYAAPKPEELEVEGEHGDIASMTVEQLAEYIKERQLSAPATVALAGDDEESINKVLDAEVMASGNAPRDDVVHELDAKLHAGVPGG